MTDVVEPIFIVDARSGTRTPLLGQFFDGHGRQVLVVEIHQGLQEIELPTGDIVRLDCQLPDGVEEITWPVVPHPALQQMVRLVATSADLPGPYVPRPGDGPPVPERLRRQRWPNAKNTKARRG